MERIVVAFTDGKMREKVLRLLSTEVMKATMVCASGTEAIRAVRQMGSAVVICEFFLPDMSVNDLAADLRGLAVLMVVAKASWLELCGGENLYKLAVPVSRSEFFATLHILLDVETKRMRRPPSRRKEEEQRIIRRAKELLMDINRMSEEEAHRFLLRRSMDDGVKMAEAAQRIIDSYKL